MILATIICRSHEALPKCLKYLTFDLIPISIKEHEATEDDGYVAQSRVEALDFKPLKDVSCFF